VIFFTERRKTLKQKREALDTIAAISTPHGEGAIAIVRLTGERSIEIAAQIFLQGKKSLKDVSSHTIHYGHIKNPRTEALVDEVMVSVMRAPKTFTYEDVVEINCHGGGVAANQILQLLLHEGARMAEPGEFTKRAFLNGRIDLSQAEAVMDLIRAKTDQAKDMAMGQLDGNLSHLVRSLRQDILETIAEVEVNIDYPEYDAVEDMTKNKLKIKVESVCLELKSLLTSAKQGKILREGLKVAIVGRPNVGKSSLLNALLREEKAIVTDVAGTTRDVIEELVNIRGIPIKLIDTAGIRETNDVVEKLGVERSYKALQEADLVLLMLNASEMLNQEDLELLEVTKNMKRMVLLNKIDLFSNLSMKEVKKFVDEGSIIKISVWNREGFNQLEERISKLFFSGKVSINKDATYLSNTRHITLIQQAQESLSKALTGIDEKMPIDLIQIDVVHCWELLGEIVGESVSDELITQLFSQFCLGK
jgi:tRNA modification GTPase